MFNCEKCDQSFLGESTLKKHTSMVHKSSQTQKKVKVENGGNSKHKQTSKQSQVFSKDSLGKKVLKPRSKGKAKKKEKKEYPCPKCDRIWNFPWELKRHLPTHDREQERQRASKYKCDDCGKGFNRAKDLTVHNRIHTGENLFDCFECGKQFPRKLEFMYHVVSHTGEKPFQCKLCENRFTQPANLRTHMKKIHKCIKT